MHSTIALRVATAAVGALALGGALVAPAFASSYPTYYGGQNSYNSSSCGNRFSPNLILCEWGQLNPFTAYFSGQQQQPVYNNNQPYSYFTYPTPPTYGNYNSYPNTNYNSGYNQGSNYGYNSYPYNSYNQPNYNFYSNYGYNSYPSNSYGNYGYPVTSGGTYNNYDPYEGYNSYPDDGYSNYSSYGYNYNYQYEYSY